MRIFLDIFEERMLTWVTKKEEIPSPKTQGFLKEIKRFLKFYPKGKIDEDDIIDIINRTHQRRRVS